MSEKRFVVNKKGIFDNQTKKAYLFVAYDWIECEIYEVVELLNEQQATINRLEKENKELKQQLDKIPKNIREVWLK